MFNDNVFNIFEKYNYEKFKVGYIDCSQVVVYNYYTLDYIISLDKGFKLFEEIKLNDLND